MATVAQLAAPRGQRSKQGAGYKRQEAEGRTREEKGGRKRREEKVAHAVLHSKRVPNTGGLGKQPDLNRRILGQILV